MYFKIYKKPTIALVFRFGLMLSFVMWRHILNGMNEKSNIKKILHKIALLSVDSPVNKESLLLRKLQTEG